MNQPKVTVLMSVYNAEVFLAKAIESILNQTYKNFEFLIIDDGSTDSSNKIIRSYQDARIRLVENDRNSGLIVSLNNGLQLAQGELIARQDADDISCYDRLEEQVRFLVQYPEVAMVGSAHTHIDEKDNRMNDQPAIVGDKEIREALYQKNVLCHGSVMYRREVVTNLGGYRLNAHLVEDYDLWLRIIEVAKVDNINKPLYQLRINLNSVSIVNRFDQKRHDLLVKYLAALRKRGEPDNLERMSIEERKQLLDRLLPDTRHNRQLANAEIYYKWADLIYYSGNYSLAFPWIQKALSNNWRSAANWILFFKILICFIVPPSILKIFRLKG